MKPEILLLGAILVFGNESVDTALGSAGKSQPIVLTEGTRLVFLGVTRGRNHMAPGYESLATANWIHTPEDAAVAWLQAEHDRGQAPNYELLVSDAANTGCVAVEKRSASHVRNGVDIQGFVLKAFPRWEKETILRVRPFGKEIEEGRFVVATPQFGPFATWAAEPTLVAKSDGDFVVTLTNLLAGVPLPHWRGRPALGDDPANKCVRISFGFQQNGLAVTNWSPQLVKTSDPAGNEVTGVISDYPEGGVYEYSHAGKPLFRTDGYFYRPGLWPGVSAWKVRLEFTRTSGFDPDEILTLSNLPVRAGTPEEADAEWSWDESRTNFSFTAGLVNGVHVKVLPPLVVPDRFQPGQKHLSLIIYTDNDPRKAGMRMTLLEASDDQGRKVDTPFSPAWAGHFSFDFPTSGEMKTLNLKVALHKSRFAEFTAKPASL